MSEVRAIGDYRLELRFEDGARGVVDLSELAGEGVFSAWKQGRAFEAVSVGTGGEVCWACGVDLCGDALYLRLTEQSPEDLFPSLAGLPRSA